MSQRHELTVISLGAVSICVLVSGVFVLVPTSGCGKDMDAVRTQYGLCNPSVATKEYCKTKYCGKDGTVISVPDDSNVPPPLNAACGVVRCREGKSEETLLAEGTPCNGQEGVCDASGSCVNCVEGTNTGCKPGGMCTAGDCTYCSNGQQEENEADVDCGGPCGPCKLGKKCASPNDCDSNLRCVDGVCCENLCNGDCELCEMGSGFCVEVETGVSDTCTSSRVCADRLCKLRAGAVCPSNSECISFSCNNGTCQKGTSGELCVDGNDCETNLTCVDHKCE